MPAVTKRSEQLKKGSIKDKTLIAGVTHFLCITSRNRTNIIFKQTITSHYNHGNHQIYIYIYIYIYILFEHVLAIIAQCVKRWPADLGEPRLKSSLS